MVELDLTHDELCALIVAVAWSLREDNAWGVRGLEATLNGVEELLLAAWWDLQGARLDAYNPTSGAANGKEVS